VQGWRSTLDRLVRERGRALVGYAYLLTGDTREAEDLFQDALLRVFSRGRPVDEIDSVEAYVRRTMLTTAVDGFRRRRRWAAVRHLVAVPETAPEPGPDHVTGARLAVRDALATLSPRERACVVLRHYDDLPLADIATTLDLSVGAVKRYLSDAHRRLRDQLGPLDLEPASPESTTVHLRRNR